MKKGSQIYKSSAGLICWLFFMVVILRIILVPAQAKPKSTFNPTVPERPLVYRDYVVENPFSDKIIEKLPEEKPLLAKTKRKENRYNEIIFQAAKTHKVDPALVKAIIMAESSYNPRAVSKVGARGLMQLMPATAKSLGVGDSFDPAANINGGVKYFKYLLTKFDGNVKLSLAAYNAGMKKARRWQINGKIQYRVTRRYIDKVLKYYQTYKKDMRSKVV